MLAYLMFAACSCPLPGNYRYVRVSNGGHVRQSSCSSSWDVSEIRVKDPNGVGITLGVHSTSTPTSTSPNNAIDGMLTNYWAGSASTFELGQSCWTSVKLGLQWIIVDAGSITSIGNVGVYHNDITFAPTRVRIECSTDGATWSTPSDKPSDTAWTDFPDPAPCSFPGSYRCFRISNGGPVRDSTCAASWDLSEIEVKDTADATLSLTVKSSASPSQTAASNAVDGILSNFWAADPDTYQLGTSCWDASKVGLQWIVVDAGSAKNVKSVRCYHESLSWAPDSIRVECSEDCATWSGPTIVPASGTSWTEIITNAPSVSPTVPPSPFPTTSPSHSPSASPSLPPTTSPSTPPSLSPSPFPSVAPTKNPSTGPTVSPTTSAPTISPTPSPSIPPTKNPSGSPSIPPTNQPSVPPTTSAPTVSPTISPSGSPTTTPSFSPSTPPTVSPSASPTLTPSVSPTARPTTTPTASPSTTPSTSPSRSPSTTPTASPTRRPTTSPSASPSVSPTTSQPTTPPTLHPTGHPSRNPSFSPSISPTVPPTAHPTTTPTVHPTGRPTRHPSVPPSTSPTVPPTAHPTTTPTVHPTGRPTRHPSVPPSTSPTVPPTAHPTTTPTVHPTGRPTRHPSVPP
eukprot:Hpha_TRINITY_DN12811_c0_g1::TRINITY_DN12811_c0_g1_i1::g.24163::m.24163